LFCQRSGVSGQLTVNGNQLAVVSEEVGTDH
jgi:hypothetical protein